MTSKIFMSPTNGEICLATPLFIQHEDKTITKHSDVSYKIVAIGADPLFYAIDIGEGKSIQAFNAEWVEKELIYICDL